MPATATNSKSAALEALSVETNAPLEFNSAVAYNSFPPSRAVWSIAILYVPAAIVVAFLAINRAVSAASTLTSNVTVSVASPAFNVAVKVTVAASSGKVNVTLELSAATTAHALSEAQVIETWSL